MIFIIEGPDGSGKTTLANQMSQQTGYPVVHRTQPKTEEEKANMMANYLAIIKNSRNIIFDRCWYSEMAYGPTMRNASTISYPDMFELERKLAKRGAIIIYCVGPLETLWARCQQRGEDYIVHKVDFAAICNAYEEVMSVPHYIPVVRYEVKDM